MALHPFDSYHISRCLFFLIYISGALCGQLIIFYLTARTEVAYLLLVNYLLLMCEKVAKCVTLTRIQVQRVVGIALLKKVPV
jgi:hypothetical protein